VTTAVNIVIADALGTPVNHTFIPLGVDPKTGTMWFEDQSQANALGYWKISVERKAPPPPATKASAEGRTYRLRFGLHEPVLANITNSTVSGVMPAPQLAYTPRSFCEFILPEEGALIDRQNMAKMTPLLLQNAQIKTMIETLGYLN
jgi:hypothetical protein